MSLFNPKFIYSLYNYIMSVPYSCNGQNKLSTRYKSGDYIRFIKEKRRKKTHFCIKKALFIDKNLLFECSYYTIKSFN